MVRKKQSARKVSVYANLATKHRTKKDTAARKKAEYLATLPKHPLKRLLYRLHPKRVAKFWFSKKGLFTALKALVVLVVIMILASFAAFAYFRKDLNKINPDTLSQRVKSTVTTYYDRNNNVLWTDKGQGDYTLVVDPKTIASCMGQATVAIEDKEFYKHGGVSLSGTLRAVISNSQGNATQGGSTLTQQLVKQVFFRDEAAQRGISGIPRKIKEMILAIEVERMYSKEQIIGMYLNESPYGGRRNGVESAAQTYFHKSAKDLSLPECSLLAAIPNNPSIYNPYNTDGNDSLVTRQQKVLDNMVSLNYITKQQADAAKAVDIMSEVQPLADQLDGIKAPHFVLMVRNQLEEQLGKTVVGDGGLKVYTTLDSTIQSQLESNMNDIFSGKMTNRDCGYTNCSNYAGFTNGAAGIEDTKTGQLLALVGSRDFTYPGYGQDNAATGFIQPGSSIKPLVYAQLFQNQGAGKMNYGSGSILSDTSTSFGSYKPQDADGKFQGNINIRQSIARSRNIPAIKAMAVNEANNEGSTWATIRAMGDSKYCTQGADAQAGLSSAIGGCGTRLVDHLNAIASLGRMGSYTPQSTILKVTNSSGQTLKQYKEERKQIIDPQAAYIVTDIMGDNKARAGLGWNQDYLPYLDKSKIHTAAKTGTSNAEIGRKIVPKDIWTVGYTPNLSMAVWFGNPDTTPLKQGNSLIPAMFFDRTMASATETYVSQGKAQYSDWYTAPEGIQNIKGELFPSYYNKSAGMTNAKMDFDKVSKKKATNCTPEGARVSIGVTKTTDPITKKEIVAAPDGYDATKDDDAHNCDDAKPSVTVTSSSNGSITVYYTHGRYQLQSIEVRQNNVVLASKQLSGDGSWTLAGADLSAASAGTIQVNLTDVGYYIGSGSVQYTP